MPQGHSAVFTDVVSAFKTVKMMKMKWIHARGAVNKHIHKVPERLLVLIFSYLDYHQLHHCSLVCKKWLHASKDPSLWKCLSLRPEHHGIRLNDVERLVNLLRNRFSASLVCIDLPDSCIVPTVLCELANRCNHLKRLTLDFSRAAQLKDFSDLWTFPCNLTHLTICLSDVIYMESFMKKIYQHVNSLRVLHVIGTYEQEGAESLENPEVLNLGKLSRSTPHLSTINLFGVLFIEDSHVDLVSSCCTKLQCLCLSFCLKVKGVCFSNLINRCSLLNCLLLEKCPLEDRYLDEVNWQKSVLRELDLSYCDLSSRCLSDTLNSMPEFNFLAVAHCEYFDDSVLNKLIDNKKVSNLEAIDLSHTTNLSNACVSRLIRNCCRSLKGLMLAGKTALTEQFYVNVIPLLNSVTVLVIGFPHSWFLKIQTRIAIDNIIFALAQHCPHLQKLEVQWDGDCLRHSESSNKYINQLRLRCAGISSITLADGEYYELVKSNFERTGKATVVRTTTYNTTHIASLLTHYDSLRFN